MAELTSGVGSPPRLVLIVDMPGAASMTSCSRAFNVFSGPKLLDLAAFLDLIVGLSAIGNGIHENGVDCSANDGTDQGHKAQKCSRGGYFGDFRGDLCREMLH